MNGARVEDTANNDRRTASDAPSGGAGGEVERRGFLARSASLTMTAGLVAGYGTLAAYAGKFLFSTREDHVWLFVVEATALPPGASMPFESPAGVRVTVTRRGDSDAGREPEASQFMALSSVCPHLGCRVHWEPQNNRYFCPCHNGEFDPAGQATGGPPLAARQELPRYPVMVRDGLLYIEMPLNTIGARQRVFLDADV